MLFIVEGPDGAGKTSFIQVLAKELQRRGRYNILISPHGNPKVPAMKEYIEVTKVYRPQDNMDMILDRCWLSEDVYGPRWRGAGLDPSVRDNLNRWAALGQGAIFILLDAPDHILCERVLKERGDDLIDTAEEVIALAAAYRAADFGVPMWRLMWPYDPQEQVELLLDGTGHQWN